MILEIHVSDQLRAAALRQAMRTKRVIDVIDDEGRTRKGRVVAITTIEDETPSSKLTRWIAR